MEAHALREQGWTISAIARHLGHDRKTVRAYLEGRAGPRAAGAPRADARVTGSYPEFAAALAERLGTRRAVLDGEVVALSVPAIGAPARPSFDRLQLRMGVARPSTALRAEVPATYVAFDVLCFNGEPVTDRPWAERRRLLEDLGLDDRPRLVVSPRLDGVDPAQALTLAEAHGMEGVVANAATRRIGPAARRRGSRPRSGTPANRSSAAGHRAADATTAASAHAARPPPARRTAALHRPRRYRLHRRRPQPSPRPPGR
ncbi:ATP-dependent DNA ligase [Actinomycetospora sp. NBC_00405]|uniref:ATP-dependent DNA ligase n=1 Tax=Actinomycetospora sp. NBC_00405 TaxID=2975952 RepID=UPI002E1A85F7